MIYTGWRKKSSLRFRLFEILSFFCSAHSVLADRADINGMPLRIADVITSASVIGGRPAAIAAFAP